MSLRIERIQGLQEAQDKNLRMIAALKPSGAFGRAIHSMTVGAHAYTAKITHVDYGALKAAHRMKVDGTEGEIWIGSGSSPNGDPSEYGIYEHARGGSHAFYARTVDEAGNKLAREAMRIIQRAL